MIITQDNVPCWKMPIPCGINKAWKWLKSSDGQSWIMNKTSHRNGLQARIIFDNGLFEVRRVRLQRSVHNSMAGKGAASYRNNTSEYVIQISRHNIRENVFGSIGLSEVGYKIYIED